LQDGPILQTTEDTGPVWCSQSTRYTNICFCGHFGRYLGKWHLQPIATTGARFPDLDIIEIDSLFVFVADL